MPTRPFLSRSISLDEGDRNILEYERNIELERSRSIRTDTMPSFIKDSYKSVIKFKCVGVSPNFFRPWEKEKGQEWSGSGFAYINRHIITNFHVISNAIMIELIKFGCSKKYVGKTVYSSPDVDLAVVEVIEDADEFWSTVTPVNINLDYPSISARVNVVGYPSGGNTICVTEGVVSRVDCCESKTNAYRVLPGKIMRIQIDAAINFGNSGGPCFHAGTINVCGVAFSGVDKLQNVGYIIPSNIVILFYSSMNNTLNYYENNKFLPSYHINHIPFKFDLLENKSLCKKLKLSAGVTGVLIKDVSPLAIINHNRIFGPDSLYLQKGDVITFIDGKQVGSDYTANLRESELIDADYLITNKRQDEITTFSILRSTIPLEIKTICSPLKSNIPRQYNIDFTCEWIVIGGMQFIPLNCCLFDRGEFISEEIYATFFKLSPNFCKNLEKETIILLDILKHEINNGYKLVTGPTVLISINGIELINLVHLYGIWQFALKAISSNDEKLYDEWQFLTFQFENDRQFVIETSLCLQYESDILTLHNVPFHVSINTREEAILKNWTPSL